MGKILSFFSGGGKKEERRRACHKTPVMDFMMLYILRPPYKAIYWKDRCEKKKKDRIYAGKRVCNKRGERTNAAWSHRFHFWTLASNYCAAAAARKRNSNKKCILIFHLRLFWDQVFNPPPPFSSFPIFQRRIIFTPESKRKVDKTFFAPFSFFLTDGRHCIFAQKLVIPPQTGARCGLRRVLKVCLFRGGRSRWGQF